MGKSNTESWMETPVNKQSRTTSGYPAMKQPTMQIVLPHLYSCITQTHTQHHLPISPHKPTSHSGANYGVIPSVKLTQSQTVCSGIWRPPVLTIAIPGHRGSLPGRTFPLLRNSRDLVWKQQRQFKNKRQRRELSKNLRKR